MLTLLADVSGTLLTARRYNLLTEKYSREHSFSDSCILGMQTHFELHYYIQRTHLGDKRFTSSYKILSAGRA